MQNEKLETWEKFLKNGGRVYIIKKGMNNKEGYNVNKVTPTTQEHLISGQEGEDDTVEYPDLTVETARNTRRRPYLKGTSYDENSEKRMLQKERYPGKRERKAQDKPKTFLSKTENNGFRSFDILNGENRNFRDGFGDVDNSLLRGQKRNFGSGVGGGMIPRVFWYL
ncbi:uncharacterized protein LOC130046445 [Ostrea edulis]|uniref:uncharacterized protein LOC130046445 n=1 Tax=Ostrea edulis TaxID=37623 RepID=UPI0024AEE795|nr:uncharacterized protein LOC130046445 [Ostrea edulis]XP_056016206.1 uncharacterized protein LOC130046445 [Ostrea edulis]